MIYCLCSPCVELEKLNISHNFVSSVDGFSEYTSLLYSYPAVSVKGSEVANHHCRLDKGNANFIIIIFRKRDLMLRSLTWLSKFVLWSTTD